MASLKETNRNFHEQVTFIIPKTMTESAEKPSSVYFPKYRWSSGERQSKTLSCYGRIIISFNQTQKLN